MTHRADVTDITIDRDQGELRLGFDDGTAGAINLVELRLACPCATCRAARQAGREPWPTGPDPAPLAVTGAELVGAWGLGVTWNDGHATGIYPFEGLREWVLSGRPPMHPDSGLGA
jgi:ATP-binding protein involved in chromosome partitioning